MWSFSVCESADFGPGIREIVLTAAEVAEADNLIDQFMERYRTADHPELLSSLARWEYVLPPRLLCALRDIRSRKSCAAVLVRRPKMTENIGPTPLHWQVREHAATVLHDLWLVLVSAQLGDPICWQTLQNGRLFNDVLPIRGQECAQTGHGSVANLDFHVEDAFDDERCDVLALMCLRNCDATATRVGSVGQLDIDESDRELLGQSRFSIRPDPEHLGASTLGKIPPKWCPVLFGDRHQPYLRVDPAYTATADDDDEAAEAFARLCDRLERTLVDIPLRPGDLLLIDNYRAVHGRGPFRPRYDGMDRWLRKLNLVYDLQRSRSRRSDVNSRVLLFG